MSIRIKTYPYGPLGSNMYALISEKGYIIVDPSVSPSLSALSGAPEAIFITHGHYDHFAELAEWLKLYPDIPVYLHTDDMNRLSAPEANCSGDFGMPFAVHAKTLPAESLVNAKFLDGEITVDVIHTPGHCEGQVLFIVDDGEDKYMFSGDMLFRGSIGRTDLSGGDMRKMQESIDLIKSFDYDYRIFPGHGMQSRLSFEKENNPFF